MPDHVVIGGGPAGSMLAIRLVAAGREVILLEKQREPHHKVCGEFLSAEALGYLRRVGVDPQQLGAHPIQKVRFHSGRKSVQARLPFAALALSRCVLDQVLIKKAEAAGCEIHRGAFVERLHRSAQGFSIQLRGGQTINTKTVFLATGKHDLADLPRTDGTQSDLVGFKMHWQLTPKSIESIRNTMELFLFRDGYGGLSLIEGDIANLCFVISQRRMRALGGWFHVLSAIRAEVPALDQILRDAFPCWTRPLAISPIPYGHLARASNGIWRIGDQAVVIPSFTGDGMSIALHTAELASEMFLSGKSPDEYLSQVRTQLHSGMRFATFLSRMMVTSTGRLLAPIALSAVPGAINWLALQTRIPDRALASTHLACGTRRDHLPISAD